MTIAFGPVPSRRLGRSLGINNIPPKSCSYSCLYCQVGATHGQLIEPQNFYTPEEIYQEISEQLQKVHSSDGTIDYLTFVPDGEPTLDINLGFQTPPCYGIKMSVRRLARLIGYR